MDGPDVRWLHEALFPPLAIGFTLLAYALARELRRPGIRPCSPSRSSRR
ncbi:hypothetical protein HUT06_17130 [Actinomadura sp. NAK00032]|nr:hypothetical protein [Actinomadura sp. NAK00032]QKW35545.1 hypothetical protein HUT06_17130 [Actinomadura sp. NAK00032]